MDPTGEKAIIALCGGLIGILLAYSHYQMHRADTWTRDQHNYDREFDIMRQNFRETAE